MYSASFLTSVSFLFMMYSKKSFLESHSVHVRERAYVTISAGHELALRRTPPGSFGSHNQFHANSCTAQGWHTESREGRRTLVVPVLDVLRQVEGQGVHVAALHALSLLLDLENGTQRGITTTKARCGSDVITRTTVCTAVL